MTSITRLALTKAVNLSSDHFTEDSFDESQKLKQHLLGSNLQYILKPVVVLSLLANGKSINKSVPSNTEKTIKLRKVKISLFNICMEKMQKGGFSYHNT